MYVDDILLTGDDASEILALKHFLDGEFKIKDLGSLNYFLSIEITYFDDGVLLNQRKFILDLLKEHDCLAANSVVCPLDLNIEFSTDSEDLLPNPATYRSLIGKLLFLTHTRPDLCFFILHLSQFNQAPHVPHMFVALHILRYLKGTVDLGLFYSSASDLTLTAYFDNDWATCADTRKSVTEFCIFLGDNLVGWKSKKKPVVSYILLRQSIGLLAKWWHNLLG